MHRSRDTLAWADEIYLNDHKDEIGLAQRYKNYMHSSIKIICTIV